MEPDDTCIVYEQGRLTAKYLEEIACQYESSANLCALLTVILELTEDGERNLAELCDCLGLETATGACLTAIGNMAGWPRTHCAAQCVVGFGFACPGDPCASNSILGWCSGNWFCEDESSATQDYTFIDDELYRRFIKARILARHAVGMASESLEVAQALLGDEVCLGRVQDGRLEIFVPRMLTPEELSILELIKRVIPVSLGTDAIVVESNGPPFGFACPDSPCQPAGWCIGGFTREVSSIC